MSTHFTDTFTSSERDTLPYLPARLGRDWDDKTKCYKKTLSLVKALEEELANSELLPLWWAVKKSAASEHNSERETFLFKELAAANVYMLLQKGQTQLLQDWAAGKFTKLFTTR
jgi:hypothetical protein